MEAFIIGFLLVIFGFLIATAGYVLFRIALPIMGFITGFGIGFSAIQAFFGANVWSFVVATMTALILGLVVGALAYAYFTIGVVLVAASLLSGAFAFLGQAIGLREEGFIVFLLALAGAVVGTITVLRYGLQHNFIIVLTSLYGVGLMFVGLFMIVGGVSVYDLNQTGIVQSISDVVKSSWVWILAWIGGSIIAMQSQIVMIAKAVFGEQYVIKETSK